ncbi:SAM-dependent methyltransferase [Demequina litorisediminis]|uniref:SAM-dependent methyltransferase n=1 Tax=Demequina litorisediminis TaxID=1849022 RepID=UPI0024E15454|nr:SAM-dependent methyltransferase [Demequina litorisediminis]
MRLDRALAERALARSRSHAQELISAGVVTVDGTVVTKASVDVGDETVLSVLGDDARYVSRAARRLVGALEACAPLGLDVRGRSALDAGASTGGFTQVLLERGVRHVRAVDVGHDQARGVAARRSAGDGCRGPQRARTHGRARRRGRGPRRVRPVVHLVATRDPRTRGLRG